MSAEVGRQVREAADHRGFSGCVQPGLGAANLDGLKLVPTPGLGPVDVLESSLEALAEPRQWTPQEVLGTNGTDVHLSQRSGGGFHRLLTQEKMCSVQGEERAAKAMSGPLQCCRAQRTAVGKDYLSPRAVQ